jgi:hypothetical protein
MLFLRTLVLLSFLLLGCEPAPVSETGRLTKENSFLKAELQLAKSPKVYAIFDLGGKRIMLKAKDVVLKEFPVESCTQWGAWVRPKPLALLGKTALLKPGRKEIKPKTDDEEDTSEPLALQLDDMPVRYRLKFDDGIRIYVRPKSVGVITTLINLLSSLKSVLVIRPLGTLWNGLHRENFTEIAVYLDEKDARSLYWSFQEGFYGIIWGE